MALYECVVYDKYKNRKKLRLDLESQTHFNKYINENELTLVSLKNRDSKKGNIRIKEKEIRILCRQMGILLESGCEITKIIEIIKSQSNHKISHILSEISSNIQIGNSITESFQKSKLFSTFFISMIKSGEISGNLDIVMHNLANYYDKEYKLKSKIKIILIYPIALIILSILSMLFIMIMVIPNFEMVFINNSLNPPLLTRILIGISTFIRTQYIYIIVFILCSIYISINIIKNNYILSKFKNNLKFKIPIIKKMTQLVITTRFCRTLSILVQSGVQIMSAIDISANVIDDKLIYDRILISQEYIKKGNNIGYSLNLSNIFPKLFISMVNIGEESGRLEESLNTIDNFYSSELDTNIEQIMKLIEPVIIAVLGIIIGVFIVAMVMPMFDAIVSI